jgi:hypothetical protein
MINLTSGTRIDKTEGGRAYIIVKLSKQIHQLIGNGNQRRWVRLILYSSFYGSIRLFRTIACGCSQPAPVKKREKQGNAHPGRERQQFNGEEKTRARTWSRGGASDIPYRFTLPTSISQVLVQTKLLAKVQHGELQP